MQVADPIFTEITPLVITLNEAPNIARTLDKLFWARRVVVVDSGSTDGTLEILSRYPQVEIVERHFDTFAEQCNFGLALIRTEWVLSLDADYELSDELVRELQNLRPTNSIVGYKAGFVYRVFGRSLRGALYPPRIILHRVAKARYLNEGHGHRVSVVGEVCSLSGIVYHDDRKPLSRWLTSQQRYAHLEAEYLLTASRLSLSRPDRIRRMAWPAPLLVLPYVLIVKGCVLDGWGGWLYAFQRMLAETMIALEILNRRLATQLCSGERRKK